MQSLLINPFIIVLLFGFSFSVLGQDLIVTEDGDSVNSKIEKISTKSLFYRHIQNGRVKKSIIQIENVKYYQVDFYPEDIKTVSTITDSAEYSRIQVGINLGWSYRIAKMAENIPPEMEDYINKLRSGYHYGADISFFISEKIGIGLLYDTYKSNKQINSNVGFFESFSENNIVINFIGPFLSTRIYNFDKNNYGLLNFSIGYTGYKDTKGKGIVDMRGSSVGFAWDVGYNFGISRNFAIGFKISYMIGVINKFEGGDGSIITFDPGEGESLSRINISTGLRFIK